VFLLAFFCLPCPHSTTITKFLQALFFERKGYIYTPNKKIFPPILTNHNPSAIIAQSIFDLHLLTKIGRFRLMDVCGTKQRLSLMTGFVIRPICVAMSSIIIRSRRRSGLGEFRE
jgi:hypothetical protein